MEKPRINSMVPVFGIDSYEDAVAHYVEWLGFKIDWEWRQAPGQPVVMAISRDEVAFMLNEHPDTPRPCQVHLKVTDIEGLAAEWNIRRPGSVKIRIGEPYEFPDLPISDPSGNQLIFEGENSDEEKEARKANVPKMRAYIQNQLDTGKPFPTPEEVRAAIGPDLGTAIEVLNEFPGYGEAYDALRGGEKS
ncbi:MAG: hypothetical protein HOH43_26805 [Candidatus Latescibacteria bacterium]|nr:hypothetical protein [Candidatus Latescibacterota bacterium]